jgi:hypothetical protein
VHVDGIVLLLFYQVYGEKALDQIQHEGVSPRNDPKVSREQGQEQVQELGELGARPTTCTWPQRVLCRYSSNSAQPRLLPAPAAMLGELSAACLAR